MQIGYPINTLGTPDTDMSYILKHPGVIGPETYVMRTLWYEAFKHMVKKK